MKRLFRLIFQSKPVEVYGLVGTTERRQEEEIKAQILRKLRKKLNDGEI